MNVENSTCAFQVLPNSGMFCLDKERGNQGVKNKGRGCEEASDVEKNKR